MAADQLFLTLVLASIVSRGFRRAERVALGGSKTVVINTRALRSNEPVENAPRVTLESDYASARTSIPVRVCVLALRDFGTVSLGDKERQRYWYESPVREVVESLAGECAIVGALPGHRRHVDVQSLARKTDGLMAHSNPPRIARRCTRGAGGGGLSLFRNP